MSKSLESEDLKKEKIFYILFIFTKSKDKNIEFKFESKKTEQIHSSKEKVNGGYRSIIILKSSHIQKNPSEIINLTFTNNGETFIINFSPNEGTFIFEPILKIKQNKISSERDFVQKNIIKITDKIELFLKCLEEKKENEKIKILYDDSLNYLESNLDYELFIYLFIKLYEENNKDNDVNNIFKKLLDIFWDKTNSKNVGNLKNKNENLKNYLEIINNIITTSEKLISDKNLDKQKFYGFILFYLNAYDMTQFHLLTKKLQEQKEKDNFYFDILIQYSSIFSNDINISLEQYINYLLGKGIIILEKSGLVYIKQVEDLIHIINKNKDKLINIKDFKPLNILSKIKYDLKNPESFITELDKIIDFSRKHKKLLIYLSGNFWKEIINLLGKPDIDDIYYLFRLRECFYDYFQCVKEKFGKDKLFYQNAEETEEKDEFAVVLDTIIQKNIEESKDISNDTIINLITKYDIYYKNDKYINRRELNFLDKINFNENEIEWKKLFKKSNFETIFKTGKIEDFLLKICSKIKNMEDFGTAIEILNDEELKNLGKIEVLISLLKKKVFIILKRPDSLKESDLKNEKLNSLKSLFILIYKYTQKLENIKDILNKLENDKKHKIFLELLKSYPKDKQLIDYIFNIYITNINIYYKNIVELLETLSKDKIKDFIGKINKENDEKKKNYKISYENFFMEKESLSLSLLQELIMKKDLIEETLYLADSKKILLKIYEDIENKKLKIQYLRTLISFPKENVIKRLELLLILNKAINSEIKYNELKSKYEKANSEIKELSKISTALKIFHKDYHRNDITKIKNQIDKFNNGEISEFDEISKLILSFGDEIIQKVEKINKIKDSSIFRNLFNNTQGANEDDRFDLAIKNLKTAFITEKKKT